MLDCTTPEYDNLYAPWMKQGSTGTLLDLAQYKTGDVLLDMCGGTGAVTQAALDRHKGPDGKLLPQTKEGPNPDIVLYDLNPRPGGWAIRASQNNYLRVRQGRAEEVSRILPSMHFDVVVIRQALGYIDLEPTFNGLAQLMPLGGRLVFNSFIDPALGVKPFSHKFYKHEGQWYFEFHCTLWDKVFHIQSKLSGRPGMDATLFNYHPEAGIALALHPWFTFEVHQHGRSLRWLCVRKPSCEGLHG